MERDFAFGKDNFIWVGIAIVLIIVGFVLMSGGGPPADGVSFNPEIFSPRRIFVAPVIVMIGYLLMMYAILKKSGKTPGNTTTKG